MKLIKTTFLFFVVMTIITGIVYPIVMTLFATAFFPYQANGSFVVKDGKEVGSSLIAQKFAKPEYFWPRPSAVNYNPMPSGASNVAVSSKTFRKQLASRDRSLPAEMAMSSGSGLDPEISIASAVKQLDRVAKARHWTDLERKQALKLIKKIALGRDFRILGEPRINVLKLNLEVDKLF